MLMHHMFVKKAGPQGLLERQEDLPYYRIRFARLTGFGLKFYDETSNTYLRVKY
ncbi:uncharacterized protein PHALS_00881 [Plasmopara halstedii]|uniref:Uncharacterized protein n=1 Tax=Plasmopara halstedii TaxID=4781 RepID=A0A0P1ATC9_PLAHL|nr:uncharacterized protein PHALS_00881 [Plasmopara halstedii]CEG44524.1 hypothetical protein PHALS_00881 [Plasmopara halstedii]|eukprot:XP_024580893.1 hypothetical protein PHALS_00881 [Plasmopara halstedii]